MKAKRVFVALGLAFVMGVGAAAAGISANKDIKPAKAATQTIYCKMEQGWWKADGAAVGLYCWGEGGTKASWPGERMTAVTGQTDLWSFDVDTATYPNVIFTRVNGSGAIADWGAQTKDLTFPTDGKNLFTITTSSATWGGSPGCDGVWGTYNPNNKHTVNTVLDNLGLETLNDTIEVVDGNAIPEPNYDFGSHFSGWFSDALYTAGNEVTEVTSDMTVYGKITSVPTKSFSIDASLAADFSGKIGIAVYAWEPSGKTNTSWPGAATPIWASSITLPEDASMVICNGTDTSAEDFTQTVDVSFADAVDGDTLILLDSKDGAGKVETAWESQGVETNNYTVKVGANTYSFAIDDDNKPEGALHQFKASLTSTTYRATVLQFYQNGTLIDSQLGVDYSDGQPIDGNNIVGDLENGFRVYSRTATMDIYLKTYSDGGRSLWATGYQEENFHLYANGTPTTVVRLPLDTDFTPNGDYVKQFKSTQAVLLETGNYWNIAEHGGQVQPYILETGDNNAKAREEQGAGENDFTVYNDCTETIYVKMKADLSLTIWIGGREHARVLTIDGVDHALEAYQEEGQPLQYRVTGVHLFAGQTISYSFDGTPEEITAKAIGNNNLNSSLVVIADAASADLYLDPVNMTLWVGGLASVGGYHLLITNVHTGKVTFLAMTQNLDNLSEYFIAAHAFKEGDAMKIIDCSSASALPTIFNPAGGLNEYSNENFEVSHGEVVCTADVTVNAYIQLSSGADKLYFGSVPEAVPDALAFVSDFEAHLYNACSQPDENKGAYVKSAWKNDIVPEFNGLSADAKAIVDQGGYSPYQEIREFAARYIYFMQAYGEAQQLANFMGWDIPSASNQYSMAKINNNSVIIIAIVASVVAISATGLFFIIKRKKFEK